MTSRVVPHGSSLALAYRVAEGERAVVYVPDVSYPARTPPEPLLGFYRGADLLIHDCTYTPEDLTLREQRGNSSVAEAALAAARARVGALVMFHYDQDYTDPQVDALAVRCRELLDATPGGEAVGLVAAAEGLTLRPAEGVAA